MKTYAGTCGCMMHQSKKCFVSGDIVEEANSIS